jgi:hypothetical protein
MPYNSPRNPNIQPFVAATSPSPPGRRGKRLMLTLPVAGVPCLFAWAQSSAPRSPLSSAGTGIRCVTPRARHTISLPSKPPRNHDRRWRCHENQSTEITLHPASPSISAMVYLDDDITVFSQRRVFRPVSDLAHRRRKNDSNHLDLPDVSKWSPAEPSLIFSHPPLRQSFPSSRQPRSRG